jgi:hypothetical protein
MFLTHLHSTVEKLAFLNIFYALLAYFAFSINLLFLPSPFPPVRDDFVKINKDKVGGHTLIELLDVDFCPHPFGSVELSCSAVV